MKKTISEMKSLFKVPTRVSFLAVSIALSLGAYAATDKTGNDEQQIVEQSESNDIDFEQVWRDELTEFEDNLDTIRARVNKTQSVLQGAQVDFDETLNEVVQIDGKLAELHGTFLKGGTLKNSFLGLRSWVGSNIDRIANNKSYTEEQKVRYTQVWNDIEDEALKEEKRMLHVQLKLEELRAKFRENHQDIIEFRRANLARVALQTLQDFLNEVDQMVEDVLTPKVHGVIESTPSSHS